MHLGYAIFLVDLFCLLSGRRNCYNQNINLDASIGATYWEFCIFVLNTLFHRFFWALCFFYHHAPRVNRNNFHMVPYNIYCIWLMLAFALNLDSLKSISFLIDLRKRDRFSTFESIEIAGRRLCFDDPLLTFCTSPHGYTWQ